MCVGDHVSFHDGTGFDGLTAATAALSGSDRLPVLVGVYLLALRHPLLTARQLASISQLAPGRLVLGAGVGGEDRSEVSNSGVDPATRGRRLDECLQVLRALASGDAVDHQGSSSSSRPRASSRRPSSAGRFRPGTASTCGAGLTPTPRRPGCCWPGRWRACTTCRSENSSGWPRPGTPAQVAEELVPYLEAGAEHITLIPAAASPEAGVEHAAAVRALLEGSLPLGDPPSARRTPG